MAVVTELNRQELEGVCAGWGLGRLTTARGLPEGSINTLYVLETERGRFVLRLSEGRREEEIRFETALLAHLAETRFPAVRLVPRPDGALCSVVKGKFSAVFQWAAGTPVRGSQFNAARAMDAGRLLARLHVVTESFPATLPNRYAPEVIRGWVDELVAESRAADRPEDPELWAAMPLLESEAAELDVLPPATEGVIHADYFLDNLHFVGDRLATVLDFEMACRGPCVLDLAVALLACCYGDGFDPARMRPFAQGYLAERPLSRSEREALHPWARFAALRFTVSRIRDFHRSPLPPDRLKRKDWRRFRDRLQSLVDMGPQGLDRLLGL